MAKQDQWIRLTLRLPAELHERLTAATDASLRSMNAEIVDRLESTFEPGIDMDDVHLDTEEKLKMDAIMREFANMLIHRNDRAQKKDTDD